MLAQMIVPLLHVIAYSPSSVVFTPHEVPVIVLLTPTRGSAVVLSNTKPVTFFCWAAAGIPISAHAAAEMSRVLKLSIPRPLIGLGRAAARWAPDYGGSSRLNPPASMQEWTCRIGAASSNMLGLRPTPAGTLPTRRSNLLEKCRATQPAVCR